MQPVVVGEDGKVGGGKKGIIILPSFFCGPNDGEPTQNGKSK
jgi:hypothetical protein